MRDMKYSQNATYQDLISIMLAVAVREPDGVDMVRIAFETVKETVEEESKQLTLRFAN